MKRKLCLFWGQVTLAFALLVPHAVRAQLELVYDINQASAPDQSNPAQFTPLGSIVIFAATSGEEGRELWKTNGTPGNAVPVKDIWPGNQSSSPLILGVKGSTAFFAANDGVHGVELWKTDGTEAGTVLVKDIFPGSESGNPLYGIVFNNTLYFTAQDYDRNYELWKSDGTEGGTVMVRDLQSNTVNPGSGPTRYVSTGTVLLFVANTDALGSAIYTTDGSSAGTVLVKDLTPGSSNSYMGPTTVMNGVVYFGAGDGSHGNELWRCDGTPAGTYMVKDISPGSGNAAVADIVAVNDNTLYFSAASSSFNNELWKSDGTDAGTMLVKEIRPGTAVFQGSDPYGFKAVGSTIYFFANDGTTGIELWKSNGTAGGTMQVKDILVGSGFGARVNDPSTAPPMLEVIGSNVYFYASDGISGGELWKSDDITGVTAMVKDLATGSANSVVRELKAIGTKLYFAASPTGGGAEPHISDGTPAGTVLLKKISTATASSNPKELTSAAGKLFFSANDGVNGRELWVVDETGAHMTRTLNTNASDNSMGGLGAMNGTVFLGSSTTPGNSDYQLFRSDGTDLGTYLVNQTAPLSALPSLPGSYFFKAAGNVGFFTGNTAALGTELWRTDGTGIGTFLLKDLYPGPDSPELGEMTALGNVLYFVGDTDEGGQELYRSDGTAAGTHIVKAISSGGSDPYGLIPLGTTLYFSADGPVGNELYKTTGTAASTALVKDIADGSSFAAFTTPLNGTTMLFTAFRQAEGTELWKTNGTAAGTVLVKNIRPGSFLNITGTFTGYGSNPFGLVQRGSASTSYGFAVINGVAYFSADDGTNGRELWKTDGTDAGTVMIKDIAPGAADSNPFSMVVVGDKIYFAVTLSGATQLWSSDGTNAGTVMVEDQVQNIDHLTVSGTDLYMVGSQTAVGTELFRLPDVRPAPFAITTSPLSKNVAPGAAFTLTGAATPISGAAPLTYLWRKNGLAIPGATTATYTVAKAVESSQGIYDLLVRSGDFELVSDGAQIDVADPARLAITQQPLPKLALTFTSASFHVDVIGQPPQFQWYKGVTPIEGANAATYTINSVQMTDAALYKVKVSNSLGSLFSATAQLAVVNSVDQFVPTKSGTTAVMSAPVMGTGLTFQWLYGGSALANGDISKRISGVTTSKLSFTKLTTDTYNFACLVTLNGQAVVSGLMKPRAAAIPIITPTASPPTWIISQSVSRFANTLFNQSNLNTGGTGLNAPIIFSIAGLPKGLIYDPKTGLITGRPQVGGGTSVTLTIKVGNIAGTITTAITVTIPIQNFPALAKGAFRGLVDRSNTTLNDNLGNYVQVDVSAIGAITGKLFRGTTVYPFIARNLDTLPNLTIGSANVSIPRSGNPVPLTLILTLDGATGAMSGTLVDGTNTAPFIGKRSPWIAAGVGANPATAYAKAYTATLQLQAGQVGDLVYPQGEAYALASITPAGAVTGAARLADGTKITYSTLLGAGGEVPLYVGAYTNTGSLHGWTQITSGTGNWDGTNSFFKAAQPLASTTRSYKAEVPLHTLTLVGGVWTKPIAPVLLFGVLDSGAVAAPNNAEILFTQALINSSVLAPSGTYGTLLRIKAPASTFVLPPAATNPGKLTLTAVTATTGEFSGAFTSVDANPVPAGKPVTRTTPYYGVIVQRLNRGRGHFNLAKLPDVGQPNPAKTEILSGLVELKPFSP